MNIFDLTWSIFFIYEKDKLKDKETPAIGASVSVASFSFLIAALLAYFVRYWLGSTGELPPYSRLCSIMAIIVVAMVILLRYRKKEYRKKKLIAYLKYKKQHPVLRLVRFWTFVLSPIAIMVAEVILFTR